MPALPELDAGGVPATLVANKTDLVDAPPDVPGTASFGAVLAVSAATGAGLDALRGHLLALAGRDASIEGVYLARRRHLEALETARDASAAALGRLRTGELPELAAEELRAAQRALEAITGRFDADDLLGAIFGSFCVGK